MFFNFISIVVTSYLVWQISRKQDSLFGILKVRFNENKKKPK